MTAKKRGFGRLVLEKSDMLAQRQQLENPPSHQPDPFHLV
jgi:hypothetical protein